jgi:hypothetical protein
MGTSGYIEQETFSSNASNAITAFLHYRNIELAKQGKPPLTWKEAKKAGYKTQRLFVRVATREPLDSKTRRELLEGLSRAKYEEM